MDIDVIVETPQGSRNKYVAGPKSGRMRLDRMLFTSTVYPLDYGFVDGTLAEDGDPAGRPGHARRADLPRLPGDGPAGRGLLDARRGGPDAKVLTVCTHDPRTASIRDLADVPRHLLNEIGHFFDIYKELEPGKSTDVRGWQDRAEAERVIKEAQVRAA